MTIDLNELERLLKEATQGPYRVGVSAIDGETEIIGEDGYFVAVVCQGGLPKTLKANAALIAAAVNALPGLIDRVQELEKELAQAKMPMAWASDSEVHEAKKDYTT